MLLLEDKIKKIVDDIDIPNYFGGNSDEDWYPDLDRLEEQIRKIDPDAYINHGISKAVIIIPSCSYVIKIPFFGEYESDYDYDEECDEDMHYDEDLGTWFPFEGASENDCSDYCLLETENYEWMKGEGFKEFFAETKFYKYKNYYPIYIQERVEVLGDTFTTREVSEASKDLINSGKITRLCDAEWIGIAIDKYGLSRVQEFFERIVGTTIDEDLHSGNIGYSFDGRPVLVDYSGWNN